MQEITVGKNESGQRLDRLLSKYLDRAPKSFLYKMLRKKNVKLNGKKAVGGEMLLEGDRISIYLSDATIDAFREKTAKTVSAETGERVRPLAASQIIYEDEDILIVNKREGQLSQKAKPEDITINEQLIAYCEAKGAGGEIFKPSVCNRLDRNTSGILLCGISLAGSQYLSKVLRERTLDKYYMTIVKGGIKEAVAITGYLQKDERANRVKVTDKPLTKGTFIETAYEPIKSNSRYTLLKVKLVTGKSHQIRAHLASIGHPIIGDYKYGDRQMNDRLKLQYGLKAQLLHACEVCFREDGSYWSGKCFVAEKPELFLKLEEALF